MQLQHDSGPIGGMYRMRMIIVLDLVECNNKEGPGTINISSREEDPEPWAYLYNAKVSTLFQEGQVTDAGCH